MKQNYREWIEQYLEGTISAADFKQLQQAMREDAAVLASYEEQAEIHGQLEWLLSDQVSDLKVEQVAFGQDTSTNKPKSKVPFWLSCGAAAAAVAVTVAVLSSNQPKPNKESFTKKSSGVDNSQPEDKAVVNSGPVARITQTRDAIFTNHSLKQGDWVNSGMLELLSGEAELTLDSGAKLTLSKGAKVDVSSARKASLKQGYIHVSIPDSSRVVKVAVNDQTFSSDNGEYSIRKSKNEGDFLTVSKGLVLANDKDSLKEVGPQQSYQLDSKELGLVSAPIDKPRWEGLSGSAPRYLHLSFDNPDKTKSVMKTWQSAGSWGEQYTFSGSTLKVKNQKEARANITATSGRFGNAIRFNGNGRVLKSDFAGVAGQSERTLACWIRVPRYATKVNAYSLVSWGYPNSLSGGKFQLAWNSSAANGSVGAVRAEVGLGYVVGETDIRDGSWHHIACVLLPSNGAKSTSHIKLYVDGQLEELTGFKKMKVDTKTDGLKSQNLMLGGRLETTQKMDFFKSFLGRMDEFYLFDKALTPSQIKDLYQTNSPPKASVKVFSL